MSSAGMAQPTGDSGPNLRLVGDRSPAAGGSINPNNLPSQAGRLIGRQAELDELWQKLTLAEPRLVTVVGPAGAGKTRLALAVAERLLSFFPDGVFLVDLSAIADQELVVAAVAQSVGVQDVGNQPVDITLRLYLANRKVLLVLDNFEHLLPAAPRVSELLRTCPDVKVLATSRSLLNLEWEHAFALEGLELPGEADSGVDHRAAAVELFAERARAVRPDFRLSPANVRHVTELCVRLDGLPLALELAAARANVLSPAAMVKRMDRPLELLIRGPQDRPARHSSLRTAMEWSYTLLIPAERIFFARLAVFTGGWTLEAAEEVCAADMPAAEALSLLENLVERSLVQTQAAGEDTRYRFLETVHEFAWEKLEQAGELTALESRHLAWLTELAERAETAWNGAEQSSCLDRLEDELANIRVALARSHTGALGVEQALQLASALWFFWDVRGHVGEGTAHLLVLLGRKRGLPRPLEAKAKWAGGYLLNARGEVQTARQLFEEAQTLFEKLGDTGGRARCLAMASLATTGTRTAEAADLAQQGVELGRQAGGFDLWLACLSAGTVALCLDRLEQAADLFRELLAEARTHGNDWVTSRALYGSGNAALMQDDCERARSALREGLEIAVKLGDKRSTAHMLEALGWAAVMDGQPAGAARAMGAAEALRELTGVPLEQLTARIHDRYSDQIKNALGLDEFASAWNDGRREPVHLAVEAALGPRAAVVDVLAAPPSPQPQASRNEHGLTDRELDVLRLLAIGHSNQEIARLLVLSSLTVGRHVSNIYGKIGVHRRAEAAAYAIRHGIVD